MKQIYYLVIMVSDNSYDAVKGNDGKLLSFSDEVSALKCKEALTANCNSERKLTILTKYLK